MADQFQYAGIAQQGQAPSYPQFMQYPNAAGDQNPQFLQGYTFAQANPAAAVFGGPSFNQNPYSQGAAAMSVPQLGAHLNAAGLGAGFPYTDYAQFNPYGQNASVGIPASLNDVQQFGQLLPNALNQSAARNIYEAIAQEQGLVGFNAAAFMQESTNALGRGLGSFSGKGFGVNQRVGMNKFENGNRSSGLPSVTNPDGLREDTVFVSKLPQNIDHDVMKSQFGTIGKIKMNAKTGMPMIWIFKERGVPKGEALVTFEDPQCVQKSIKWFSDNDFFGKKIEVKQAKNSQRPVIIPSGGQQYINPGVTPNRPAGVNQLTVGSSGLTAFTGSDRQADMYGEQFDPRSDGTLQGRSNVVRPPINPGGMRDVCGSGVNRVGEWCCQSCGRINFAALDQCKQCGAPRPDESMMMMMMSGPPQRGPPFPPPQMSGAPTANGGPLMGPGGPPPLPHRSGPMMPPPLCARTGAVPPMNGIRGGVSGMPMRGGRGGGPIRGTSINAGRSMRTTPY